MLSQGVFSSAYIINLLNDFYKGKEGGLPFCSNDLTQYLRRGYIPHRYGGYSISVSHKEGKMNFIKVGAKLKTDENQIA